MSLMKKYSTIVLILFAMACNRGAPDNDSAVNAIETPAISNTIWTSQTELFVEYPVLVVGKTSRFAAHFTVLERHQPVRKGSVTVSLIKGISGIRHKVEAPSSPGIFTPALQPKEAGDYQLIFELKTPTYTDRIVVGNVKVYGTLRDAIDELGETEDDEGISFLKEQAWKMGFQTVKVAEKEIYDMIPTYGIWKVATSDDQTLTAPATGTLKFTPHHLTAGKSIKAGEMLMEIVSSELTTNNLNSEIAKAKASLDQAKASYDRISDLYQSKITSKTEFEKAKEKYLLTKTNYETLSAGFTGKGKEVLAPFNGYVLEVNVENGDFVEQGKPLIKVTIDQNHVLQTKVNTSHSEALNDIQDIRYKLDDDSWSSMNAANGKVISVSLELTADDPMLSVYAELQEDIHMPDGSYTEVQVAVGAPIKSLVVPNSALIEDYGQYSVIVQLSGELFEKRNVTIGRQNGDEVEIKSGLQQGEVVVTKGAYHVKMASMSGSAPAHGHTH